MADEPAILNRRLLKLHALQPSVAKEAPLQQATPCQCTAQIGPIERDVAPRVDPVVVPGAHGCLAKVAVGEGASYNLAAPKTPIRTDRPVEATVSDGRVEEAQTGQARMTQVQALPANLTELQQPAHHLRCHAPGRDAPHGPGFRQDDRPKICATVTSFDALGQIATDTHQKPQYLDGQGASLG